ncbi:uncharacterized protein [Macrobrachium rosenbergii]|uniref:uncharacterized protein n=1 Tax=Macrobrachium rosenbergii TaxID=79674 RepID=UPI0034D62B35
MAILNIMEVLHVTGVLTITTVLYILGALGMVEAIRIKIPSHYNYNYVVHDEHSGNHFGHEEYRHDYKTEGKYFVHLPDGRIQTVTYHADETGYYPRVSFEGDAQFGTHIVTLLLVVGVASLALGDVRLHHDIPGHHGSYRHVGSHGHHGSHGYHGSHGHHGNRGYHGSHGNHGSHGHHGSHGYHGSHGHHSNYDHETYEHHPAHYDFEYVVHDEYSGNHFGHEESRQDYKTEGKYFVHLPDGRVQTVTYYADETGYHPEVSYQGEARYDAHGPHHAGYRAPAKSYHAPEPIYH